MFQEVADDEKSKWLRNMLILAIGGIILVFSPDIVNFITGIDLAAPPEGLPAGFVTALQNLNTLLRYAGGAMIVIGGAVYVIKMEFRESGKTSGSQRTAPQVVRVG